MTVSVAAVLMWIAASLPEIGLIDEINGKSSGATINDTPV